MGHGNQRLEIELVQTFMPVLVTSNFDDDLIKNEYASMATPFSHYKSMGNVLDLKGNFLPSQWSNLAEIQDFMHVLLTSKYKKDQIKNNREKVKTSFSPL